jgi:hypothetical protein
MSRFFIDSGDQEGIVDAINYALSGPTSLGQDYNGVSFSDPGWLTGSRSAPFTLPTPISPNIAAIACSLGEKLSPNTFRYTFAAAQPAPPFFIGANITAAGFTPGQYNRTFDLGVLECTTTYVIARIRRDLGDPGNSTVAGTVALNLPQASTNPTAFPPYGFNATDGDVRDIKITGGTERAFVSAQLLNTITYEALLNSAITYTVAVNRYRARTTNQPWNLDYVYEFEKTIARRTYDLDPLIASPSFTISPIDTVFVNIIDAPDPGLIRYILEIQVETTVGDAVITQCELGYRSLSCQVIKQ